MESSTEAAEILRTNRVHISLIRPVMFMGAERELALLTLLTIVTLVMLVQTAFSILVGGALYFLFLPLLRLLAGRDPQFSKVFRKSIGFPDYYPAKATPFLSRPPRRTSFGARV